MHVMVYIYPYSYFILQFYDVYQDGTIVVLCCIATVVVTTNTTNTTIVYATGVVYHHLPTLYSDPDCSIRII